MSWTAAELPDLSGRVAVVTGANSGIGWHTARELAAHGAHVVLACRNNDRAKLAAERIARAAAGADVDIAHLDLASVASIQEFAATWTGPLDLLVNNAGVMCPPRRSRTEDGFELQFGTNHLGHFVLTGLLLPALCEAGTPRVVTVSSLSHRGGTAHVASDAEGGYDAQRAYANAKLANLLFAFELQRRADARGLPLSSTAAHPGLAATGLFTAPDGLGAVAAARFVAPLVVKAIGQTAASGARAVLYAATAAARGSFSGPQRVRETRGPVGPARASELARDERLARRLWAYSEELTGLRYAWPSP